MEQLLFLTACCTPATVITLLPSIIQHRETKTDFSIFPLLPLLSTCPPCGITVLPVNPTAIHLGIPSPQSDNRLYLDALFWGTVVCVCVSGCVRAEKFPVHFHVILCNTGSMKPNPKRTELCTCTVLIVSGINATLLSLIYFPWSSGSLGAL